MPTTRHKGLIPAEDTFSQNLEHTLRHSITTGAFTLPLTVVAAALAWAAPQWDRAELWMGFMAALVLTYMLMELNNRQQLLRIRSRMVSSTFLLTLTACLWLHGISTVFLPAIALVAMYFLLFYAYQEPMASGRVFYAFMVLAIALLWLPQLVFLVPLLLFSLIVQLRSFSWRTFFAALLGVLVPLAYFAAWALWQGAFPDMLMPLFSLQPTLPTLQTFTLWQMVNAGWLLFLTLLALIHYYRTNFNDKIRVRMFFYIIIEVEVMLWAGLVFYPQSFDAFFLLLLVNTAPLTAHYFTLARGRWLMTAWFVFNILLLVFLGLYNYGLIPQIPR